MTEFEIEFFPEQHEYRVDGRVWRSVTQVIGNVMGDPFGMIPVEVLIAARDRGRRIHRAIEYANQSDLDWSSIAPEDKPFIESYFEWVKTTDFKLDLGLTEKRILIKEYQVAGTLDLGGSLWGRDALIDLKTGQIDPKRLGLQTAGYCLGLGEIWRDRYGLQLRPGKIAKLIPCKNAMDYVAFKAMCTVDAWMRTQ